MNSPGLSFSQSWSSAEWPSSQPRWICPPSSSAGGGCVCHSALEPQSQRVRGSCCHPCPPRVHKLPCIPALPTPGPAPAAEGGLFPAGRSLASPGFPCCAPPSKSGHLQAVESAFQLTHMHRPVAGRAPAVFPQLPAAAGR